MGSNDKLLLKSLTFRFIAENDWADAVTEVTEVDEVARGGGRR